MAEIDWISRQDAIDKVDRIISVNHLREDLVWFTPIGVKTLIRDMPSAQPEITLESAIDYLYSIGWMQEHDRIMSAQPERKKGKWSVYRDCEGKSRYVTCNICGHEEFNWYDPNFCPHCGAEMEGES